VNQGNIQFFSGAASSSPAGAVNGADNGLTLAGTSAELGQALATAGNPGKLTNEREIPLNGYGLAFVSPGARTFIDKFGALNFQVTEADPNSFTAVNYTPHNYGHDYGARGTAGRFQSSWGSYDVNPSGRLNVVGNFWHYNTNAGGGRENTNEAAFRFGTETHYEMAGGNYFEFHLPEMIFRNGDQSRIFSWYIFKDSATSIVLNGHATDWNFFTNPLNDTAGLQLTAARFVGSFSAYTSPAEHGNSLLFSNIGGNGFGLLFDDSGLTLDSTSTNPYNRAYKFPGGPLDVTADLGIHGGSQFMIHAKTQSAGGKGLFIEQQVQDAGAFYPIWLNNNAASAVMLFANVHPAASQTFISINAATGRVGYQLYDTTAGHTYEFMMDEASPANGLFGYNGAAMLELEGLTKSLIFHDSAAGSTANGALWFDATAGVFKIRAGGTTKTITAV
jgi:hypothetical protein